MLPRQGQANGRIGDYEIHTSLDGESWGTAAAAGKFSGGQGLERVLFDKPLAARFIRLTALREVNGNPWTAVAELDVIALRSLEPPKPRDEWSIVNVSSEQIGEGEADYLIDGKPNTFWHTQYGLFLAKHPHEVTIDLGQKQQLAGMTVLPRQNSRNGRIKRYAVAVSDDGASWSDPVAQGELTDEADVQAIRFDSGTAGRFVRFTAIDAHDGDDFATAAELDFRVAY